MENREQFKRVVEGINQLEQQLLSINEDAQMNEKYGVEEVEKFFARCEQAMAARKGTLLRELGEKVTTQSMSSSFFSLFSISLLCIHTSTIGKAVVASQEEVNKAIKARRKLLEAGSFVYETDINTADHVWKVNLSSFLFLSLFSNPLSSLHLVSLYSRIFCSLN